MNEVLWVMSLVWVVFLWWCAWRALKWLGGKLK